MHAGDASKDIWTDLPRSCSQRNLNLQSEHTMQALEYDVEMSPVTEIS